MADEYREYLAARVLAESRPVTYRLLSRALTVNVNTAKQMLYDFYTKQNAKAPKSVHATYLLTGRKRNVEHTNGTNGRDGDDIIMQSSPPMSSMPLSEPQEPAESPVPRSCVVLVREEELESKEAEFEEITSKHIYSLEPGPIENLHVLSVCNQEVASTYSNEDPMERWRLYGSIHNAYVKRRTTKYTPPAPAPSKVAPKVAAKPRPAASSDTKATPASKEGGSEPATSGRSTPQPTSKPSTLKKTDSKSSLRKDKSDFFKSFAKAKPTPKEAAKESPPAATEDATMQGMSEDEGEDEEVPEVKFDEEKAAQLRKARADRDAELKRMMEESDEEMPDVTSTADKDSQEPAQEKPSSAQPDESEAAVTVSQGGRRRGRRKVMKKKKVKDEDGYLVTIEEPAWESFSEDEPQPKKHKPAPKPASSAKGKTGKFGQGSIASFFKKK